jgi:hypothetical protein
MLSSVPRLAAEHDPSTLLLLANCLKLLGRSSDGSEALASLEGLSALVELAGLDRGTSEAVEDETKPHGDAECDELDIQFLSEGQLSLHAAEALRCLANTMTLRAEAREVAPPILLAGPVHELVPLLGSKGWASFLAARILFLGTAGSGSSDLVARLVNTRCVPEMQRVSVSGESAEVWHLRLIQ